MMLSNINGLLIKVSPFRRGIEFVGQPDFEKYSGLEVSIRRDLGQD